MAGRTPPVSVDRHFERRGPAVRATYDRLLAAVRSFGPVGEDPKATSIHLVHGTAFAGIATRKDSLILTIRSATDIHSPRVLRRRQVSTRRWHIEVRLADPAQVDAELSAWLHSAFDLSTV